MEDTSQHALCCCKDTSCSASLKLSICQKLFVPKGLQLSFKLLDSVLQLIASSVGLLSLCLSVLDLAFLLQKLCTCFSQLLI